MEVCEERKWCWDLVVKLCGYLGCLIGDFILKSMFVEDRRFDCGGVWSWVSICDLEF